MTMIPAAFDGHLHLKDVLMLVSKDGTPEASGMARLGEVITSLTSHSTVALRVKNKVSMGDVRLSPEEALLVGNALIRCAYRALDQKESDAPLR